MGVEFIFTYETFIALLLTLLSELLLLKFYLPKTFEFIGVKKIIYFYFWLEILMIFISIFLTGFSLVYTSGMFVILSFISTIVSFFILPIFFVMISKEENQ